MLRGAGDVYGDGTSLALAPGQGYRFGGQDLNNYALLQPVPPDDFDRWAQGRRCALRARRRAPLCAAGRRRRGGSRRLRQLAQRA
ncbi:hypothetical protein [Massilia phosphatilytica]